MLLLACVKDWDRQEHARIVALAKAERAEQATIERARGTLSTGAGGIAGSDRDAPDESAR